MIGRPLIVCELLNLSRAPRTYALRFLWVFVLASVAALAWPWGGRPQDFHLRGVALFHIFFWAELVAATWLVPAIVAPAISVERERHTLDLLAVSPLTEFEIVFGKLVANSALIGSILLAGLPIAFASLLLGGVEPMRIATATVSILVCAVFSACLSILMSASCERSGIATSIALVLITTLIVVTLFAGLIATIFYAAAIRAAGPWASMTVFFGICPWSCYVADAVDPSDVTWLNRGLAWGIQLGVSAFCLLIATWVLRSSRSPKSRKALPAPPAALSRPSLLAFPPTSSVLPMPPGVVAMENRPPAQPVPMAIAAAPAILPPDGIPMAMMPPPAPPRTFVPAELPLPPSEAWVKYRKSMKSHLPVKGNPIFWKETTFSVNLGRQVLVGLSAVACGVIVLLAVAFWLIRKFGGGGAGLGDVHYTLLFELGVLVILVTGAGASTIGPERLQGTLPLLLGTGASALSILRGKLLAAARGLWPVLALVAVHLLVVVVSFGWAGVWIFGVFVLTVALVASVSTAASMVAGLPRRATPLTFVALFALWGVPAIAAGPATPLRSVLSAVNPFSLVALFVGQANGATSGPDPVAVYLFAVACAILAPALIGFVALGMERRIRA
ncbi:MAG: ABC transporter permease subunit [Planctomycetes bacterium]|nr:ABC transporter permease subunit [Planctomycetota bacterium]